MAGRSKGPAHSGVHAVLGADSYRAEETIDKLLDAALGRERGNAVEVLHGDEVSWAQVVEAARTGSLFASRRVVVVRNAKATRGSGEEILEYLAQPTAGVTVVLVALAVPFKDDAKNKRPALWKKLEPAGAEVHNLDPLKGRSLRAYVEKKIRERSLRLEADGLEELIERVGQDLRRLMGEIEKLEAFSTGEPLGADDVARVLGRGLAQPFWALSDAVVRRQLPKALQLGEDMLDEGEQALTLLAVVHGGLRQLRTAGDLHSRRLPPEEIASRLRLRPNMLFKLHDMLAAARGWTDEELAAALAAFHRADRLLKAGGDPRATLTAALVAACGGPGPGGPSGPPRGR